MLTIDTSVWINSVVPSEPGHAASLALLNRLRADGTTPVWVPKLVRPEVAGAVSRVIGDPGVAIRFAGDLIRLPFVRAVLLTGHLAEVAARLAADQKLRGADLVYAAVALEYGCDLVSLDKEHLNRLTGVVRTLTPAAALATLPPSP